MMNNRHSLVRFFAAGLLALSAVLACAAPQPWDEKGFQAAQAAGKPILVDVYANW